LKPKYIKILNIDKFQFYIKIQRPKTYLTHNLNINL